MRFCIIFNIYFYQISFYLSKIISDFFYSNINTKNFFLNNKYFLNNSMKMEIEKDEPTTIVLNTKKLSKMEELPPENEIISAFEDVLVCFLKSFLFF